MAREAARRWVPEATPCKYRWCLLSLAKLRPVDLLVLPQWVVSDMTLSSRARLRPVCLLITVATVLVVAGLTTWRVQVVFNARTYETTSREVRFVSMALSGHSKVCGRLPYSVVRKDLEGQSREPGSPNGRGRPLYSWRVELVRYLVSWHGTWDPSQPWDHPANKELAHFSSFYAYGTPRPEGRSQPFPDTNLLAITGPGTAFGDGIRPPMAVKDVPPQTILVVETRSSGIPWPAPGDFDIRTMPRTINAPDGKGISSRISGAFHVIFADEWTWLLSDKVPFETLEQFFTIANAEKHDREILLGPYALHQGP